MIQFSNQFIATSALALIVVGALMGFGLAYVVWRRGETSSSRRYAVLMIANSVWCLLYALELVSPFELAQAIHPLIAGVTLVAIIQWLRFNAEYTGYASRIPRVAWTLLWVESAAYFAVIATNRYHGLVFTDVQPASFGPLTLVDTAPTGLFWLQVGIIYAMVLTGLAFLVVFFVRTRSPYRRQAGAIVVGSLAVMVGNALYLVGASSNLDLTPISFVANGIVIWWALFHYDFLDVRPFASDLLLDEMEDPVVVVDEDDDVLDHNPAATEVFESETGAVVGEPLSEVVPGLGAAVAADDYFVMETGEGTRRKYDPSATTFSDQHDASCGQILVLRDVTVQQRREKTLESLQSATREFIEAENEQQILETAVRTADDVLDYPFSGVLRHDPDEAVLRSAALTDELAEMVDNELVIPHGEGPTWEVFETNELRRYDSETLSDMVYDHLPIERMLVLPLGDYGVLGVGSRTADGEYTDDDVRFVELLGTAVETALDRVDRESALRESQQQLEERNQQIELFNGVLRHDVLNGLTVVSGNADLLEAHVDPEGEQSLQQIDEWTEDMATLVERVRSTLDAVASTGNLDSKNLSAVVERNADKLRATYDSVDVSVDVPPMLRVAADEVLDEVVGNVCTNAVEHNDADTPEVTITASRFGNRVALRVADNGPGIPDDLEASAFDHRVTSHTADAHGFGLHFVTMMMDRYGGEVGLEESTPRGTEVVLEFVRGDAMADDARQITASAKPPANVERSADSDGTDPETADTGVLVVDDERAVTDLYESWLQEYDTVVANSGSEALAFLDQHGDDVSVVLLDRKMPGMSGDDVLDELRARDLDCQVGMITALAPDSDIVDMPFDDYVKKPTSGEKIRDTVETLLERAEYADKLDRYYTLVTKHALLTAEKSRSELRESDEFSALKAELRAVERELANSITIEDHQEFQYVIRDVAD